MFAPYGKSSSASVDGGAPLHDCWLGGVSAAASAPSRGPTRGSTDRAMEPSITSGSASEMQKQPKKWASASVVHRVFQSTVWQSFVGGAQLTETKVSTQHFRPCAYCLLASAEACKHTC